MLSKHLILQALSLYQLMIIIAKKNIKHAASSAARANIMSEINSTLDLCLLMQSYMRWLFHETNKQRINRINCLESEADTPDWISNMTSIACEQVITPRVIVFQHAACYNDMTSFYYPLSSSHFLLLRIREHVTSHTHPAPQTCHSNISFVSF